MFKFFRPKQFAFKFFRWGHPCPLDTFLVLVIFQRIRLGNSCELSAR